MAEVAVAAATWRSGGASNAPASHGGALVHWTGRKRGRLTTTAVL
eukprot:CAMPEP_0174898662 /NCGR_PEP_ID=MMETSP0167-20121228/22940_1 /TAXON_ID=38298 /ORGANISM="Rhodella maculata, Strain CCMP736" /LENGTH=44 /DNA_ID= /DNA_START= /DNA_END= /DNA_ORIENTATION=